MHKMVRRFRDNEGGNVAMIFALASVPLVMASGGAVDFARVRGADEGLQYAADAAALNAAIVYGFEDPIDDQAVRNFMLDNLPRDGSGNVPTFSVSRANGEVTVNATLSYPTLVAGLAGIESVDVDISATARILDGDPMCMLLLEPRGTALNSGASSSLHANCGLHVNSSSTRAVVGNARSEMITESNRIVGQAQLQSSSRMFPEQIEGWVEFSDPMEGYAPPNMARRGRCDYTNYVVTDHDEVLSPGVYCGLTISPGSSAVMEGGIYVIRNDELWIRPSATLRGSEVSIYFQGNGARLNMEPGSNLLLTAPTTGEYQGIALFQDPAVRNADMVLANGGDMVLQGLVYVPNNTLVLDTDASSTSIDMNVALIVRDIQMTADANFTAIIRADTARDFFPPEVNEFIWSGGNHARLIR